MENLSQNLTALLNDRSLSQIRNLLNDTNNIDIADALNEIDMDKALVVFRMLPKDDATEVFSYLDPEQQMHIVEAFTDSEVSDLIEDLFMDDAVDFLEEVPANVVKKVLKNATPKTRSLMNRFLQYPEDSAGSIMTIEFADLYCNITVAQAIERIRNLGIDRDTINTLYIKGERRSLIGTLSIHKLLISDDDELIKDIMDKNFVSVNTFDHQEDVAEKVRKYDLVNIPVIDNEGKLVGIITSDDIIDVIDEENTEDIEKMAAMSPSSKTYLKTGVLNMAKNRIVWLLILMISATFTGMIIGRYEELLQSVVVLTAFIPMLMDTGGNCGSQSSTLVIRGLALGELTFKDLPKILWKELRVSLIVGSILGLVFIVKSMFIPPVASLEIAIIVAMSLFCTVVIAKLIGGVLPVFADKIGLDPAIMASPMITTIVDTGSLLIYFFIATQLFHIS